MKKKRESFLWHVEMFWAACKNAFHTEYHSRLRRTLIKILKTEEKEYQEFVALMEVNEVDKANAELQAIGNEVEYVHDGAIHKCAHCGDTQPAQAMSSCDAGQICYKCRHELENRE